MVALIKPTAVASSGPSGQLMVLPATVQVPPPGSAGWLRVKVTGPVRATPAGKASVKSVCSELPGPLLTTPIVQVKGCISVTVAALLVLVTRRSSRCRVVVASPSVLLARSVSGSLALVTARLLKTSPLGAGRSSASNRKKTVLLCPVASSPRWVPVVAVPAGTSQLKVASATPTPELMLAAVHNEGELHTALAAPLVSQTKRTRLAAGGVMVSSILTPVPNDGPVLLTITR